MSPVPELSGFEVTTAECVTEALQQISSNTFDVLISDLQMPGAGDRLTVVSAMRHSNPRAVALLLSAFPDVDAGAQAILLQADEILVKPMDLIELVDVIKMRLASGPARTRVAETVAMILERTVPDTIMNWFALVELEAKLMVIPMSRELRCADLPRVFRDLVSRLKCPIPKPLGTKELISVAAAQHGEDRRQQGHTAAMMVEESRMLQVCIFQTLQHNLAGIDFSTLLIEVMTIADEVDCQLSQAMESYIARSVADALPA